MKYIVWDWNGTLFDDAPVCLDVMNGMLRRRGIPRLTPERYSQIFTFPVQEYYAAAGLDLAREPFGELAVEFITEYNRRAMGCGLRRGAREVLEALRGRGYAQLIASASERGALLEQVERCGIGEYFEALLGLGDVAAATKEGLAREYLGARGIAPSDAVFIGDTGHDWRIARDLGCRCLLIESGHESRARLERTGCRILPGLEELLTYI